MLKLIYFILAMISFQAIGQSKSQIEKLEKKGIRITSQKSIEISEDNISKILSFDFSSYRNEKSVRLVQIFNGPEIELVSFNELKKTELLITEKLDPNKINEDLDTESKLIKIKTLVDLGYSQTSQDILK